MRAVVFDIDGTLLQSATVDDDLYCAAVSQVLGPVKFRKCLADYDHVSDSGILRQVLVDNQIPALPDPKPEILSSFIQSLRRHIETEGPFQEIPGARLFFDSLRTSPGVYVALATGGWAESASLKLRSAGFDLTKVTLSAADHEYDRTRIMASALNRPESSFDSITYYGDGPWDKVACGQLGWKFVAVGKILGGLESFCDQD